MSKMKIAFAGFRHSHIFALYNNAVNNPQLEICAICEEAPEESLLKGHPEIAITHTNYDQMLAEVPCDIIAIGDYYTKRGSLVIRALKAGKHVIADKPICTSAEELEEIAKLTAEKGLKLGCMYDLRCNPLFYTAKEEIAKGTLGEILQIQFSAQHPLMRASRPGWYFEPGKHGGTITDIASHATDIIPWITGLKFDKVIAARTWQAMEKESDCFKDAAQFMITLENGCGVMGDVSYSAPDSMGYSHDCYWRFNIWGTKGMMEFSYSSGKIKAWLNGYSDITTFPPSSKIRPDYLEDFLLDIAGKEADLNTEVVLEGTRQVIRIQDAAV